MFETMFKFWLIFGAVLIFAEFFLPGLISVFIGLGAFSVAGLLYLNYIDSVPAQLMAWFISSTIYFFSLRLLVIRFYLSDTEKQNINEEQAMIGKVVEVVQRISGHNSGRIRHGESTWTALNQGDDEIKEGEKVMIVGQDNISWIVKKVTNEEI